MYTYTSTYIYVYIYIYIYTKDIYIHIYIYIMYRLAIRLDFIGSLISFFIAVVAVATTGFMPASYLALGGWMYMYVYICIYMYIYVHIYVYICIYICMHIYLYIHIYVYIYIYIYVYVFHGWTVLNIFCWAVLLYLYLSLFVCRFSYLCLGWSAFLCIRFCDTPRCNLFKVNIIIIIIRVDLLVSTNNIPQIRGKDTYICIDVKRCICICKYMHVHASQLLSFKIDLFISNNNLP
jgi:hypothetical protein